MAEQSVAWESERCGMSGCIGIRTSDEKACLAHVDPRVQDATLVALQPGADLDLRGTPIDTKLLGRLLNNLKVGDEAILGKVQFDRAQFSGPVSFDRAQFKGPASFDRAQFSGPVSFDRAQFNGPVSFDRARFNFTASFKGAQFRRESTSFKRAQFNGDARFQEAWFRQGAQFTRTKFGRLVSFREVRFLGKPASFEGARFPGNASFSGALFSGGGALFDKVQFSDTTWFDGAQFPGGASFSGARLRGEIRFGKTQFTGDVRFDRARISGQIRFVGTQFSRNASFEETQFQELPIFREAQFSRSVQFDRARFMQVGTLGPLFATSSLAFDQATFQEAIIIEATSPILSCIGTRFNEMATLRLRYAEIVLDRTVFAKPSTLAFADGPFKAGAFGKTEALNEGPIARAVGRHSPQPRLLSVRGVDVATLTMTQVDLAACLFQGGHHLDQVRIEGRWPFATTPADWKFLKVGNLRIPVWRWTRRQTLAEEHHWRAGKLPSVWHGQPHPQLVGWSPPATMPPPWLASRTGEQVQPLGEDRLALLYRALRKAREDSRDEPGAADFYYGEMEMRRLDRRTPWAERVILSLYWLVSGYGLRGLRALVSLGMVVVGLAALLQLAGYITRPSPSTYWGSLLYAASSTLSIIDPQVQLTGWGKLCRILLRLAGPLLLGLTLLSVRNRVKR